MHLRLIPQENAMTTKNFSTKTAKQCISHFLLWKLYLYFKNSVGIFPRLAVCSLFSFPPTNRSSIQLIVHQNDHFLLHDEKKN